MATREENIKKINEELDKAAGGSWRITEKEAQRAEVLL